jgi:hypothetical protein
MAASGGRGAQVYEISDDELRAAIDEAHRLKHRARCMP